MIRNLIDLLLVPGVGHRPGLPQETIRDYETADALLRLERGETPVAIEMSQFEDTGPPVIDTGLDLKDCLDAILAGLDEVGVDLA